MDSFYITSPSPKQSKENFIQLLDCCLRHKYDFSGVFGSPNTLNFKYPTIIVSQKETPYINEEGMKVHPNMYFRIFEEEDIFERNEYYPIIKNKIEYYPIFRISCREPLYSLAFVIHFLQENPNTYVANVNLNILTLQELQQMLEKKDYNWEYLGELPEARLEDAE